MLDRISSFFGSKKKKSSSRQHSDAASPTSPLSQHEDGLKAPSPSGKDGEQTDEFQTGAERLSQSSSPSASSSASLPSDDADLPFADSNSSGRSSVREVTVCRVSTAKGERNSGNVTPTTLDLAAAANPSADMSSELSFSESVVEEVSKRLQASLENIIPNNPEGSSEDSTVSPNTMTSFKIPLSISSPAEAPKSPNLTSISLASKKTFVKVGETGHSTAIMGVRLRPQLSTAQMKEDEGSLGVERENSRAKRKARIFSGETATAAEGPFPEREELPSGDSPVLHKAIWVETYLGEEEEGEREGEKERDIMKQEEEDFRADSPPVLAIPVRVIPEDDSAAQGATHSPSSLETLAVSGSLPESTISLAATTGELQTTSQPPEQADTSADTKQSPLEEKDEHREIRVTRKTVNLPSKQRVFAQKANIHSGSLDRNESPGEEYSADLVLAISDTAEVKP